jgi:hypothetical protein
MKARYFGLSFFFDDLPFGLRRYFKRGASICVIIGKIKTVSVFASAVFFIRLLRLTLTGE